MITREQVADLRPGDDVIIESPLWPQGTELGGPLWDNDGALCCASFLVRRHSGEPTFFEAVTLTVVSRAPRLYVNHDRAEPVPGDVARGVKFASDPVVVYGHWEDQGLAWRHVTDGYKCLQVLDIPASLRLLVDGETGQVVP